MLTERRKADRETMAAEIEKLVVAHGATCTREAGWPGGSNLRCIMLKIVADRGLQLSLDFSGDSCQPNVYVLSWHIDSRSDACLSWRMGSVNPYHFGKSTDVAHGFDELCKILAQRLDMAADGSAFDAEREAQMIAKNGETAAERNERWQRFFERPIADSLA